MNESDDMTFARFVARFARIEAMVPGAPTMSEALVGRRPTGYRMVRAAVLVGAVVLLAAAIALAAAGSRPAPRKYVLSSYPNAEVICEPDTGPLPSVLAGDPCPAAISAVEASTATIGVPIVRVVVMPGPFGGCGDVWSLSTPASSCYPGYHVVPGTVMHAWVAFADTERILPVYLWRTLLPGTDIPEAWPSGGFGWNFTWATSGGWEVPPAGWAPPTATPSPAPGTLLSGGFDLVCDKASTWPLAPTCAAAANAALPPAPGLDPAAIDTVEYRFGAYCPPGAPCASAPPNYGYLIVRLRTGGVVLVTVSADPAGTVTVESSQPFASTPPGM